MYSSLWYTDRRRLESWRAQGVSTLVTAPTEEPVSVEFLKSHSRLQGQLDDDQVYQYLKSARAWIETYTGRALFEQTWRYTLDYYCSAEPILLPKVPLISVTSITSYNASDVSTVMLDTTYFVDTAKEPGRVYLKSGYAWPSDLRYYNSLVIDYKAGYGTTADDLPQEFIQAICLLAAHWYEHREGATDVGLRGIDEIPFGVRALVDPYRVTA